MLELTSFIFQALEYIPTVAIMVKGIDIGFIAINEGITFDAKFYKKLELDFNPFEINKLSRAKG